MTTNTPTQGIAARARAAHHAEQERQATQRARELAEHRERLLADLDKHLSYLGISKEEIEQAAGWHGSGPAVHMPYNAPGDRPDYAYVTIDGIVFALGIIWGIKGAFVVSLPCVSGDGHPSVKGHYVFTGVIQDYLRQLGAWVEKTFDRLDVAPGLCADCLLNHPDEP